MELGQRFARAFMNSMSSQCEVGSHGFLPDVRAILQDFFLKGENCKDFLFGNIDLLRTPHTIIHVTHNFCPHKSSEHLADAVTLLLTIHLIANCTGELNCSSKFRFFHLPTVAVSNGARLSYEIAVLL
jgi:hypothetical protein